MPALLALADGISLALALLAMALGRIVHYRLGKGFSPMPSFLAHADGNTVSY